MEWINKNKFNILVWFSTCTLTLLLTLKGNVLYVIIGVFLSTILSFILIFNKKILKKVIFPQKLFEKFVVSIFTIFSLIVFVESFVSKYLSNENFQILATKILGDIVDLKTVFIPFGIILGISSLATVFIFWSYILKLCSEEILRFLNNLKIDEKIFLLLFSLVFSSIAIFTFTKTNLFYLPETFGKIIQYDVMFTSDTGDQYLTNVFMSIGASENDIRQPLFGLYSLPMGTLAYIISNFFFFIPNSFALFLQILQIIMLGITVILIGKMMKLEKIFSKIIFYIFLPLSYSFLIWIIPLEQYIICYFFLILFIYDSLGEERYLKLLYIGATGTLLTSGILFPLLFKSFNLKKMIKEMIEIGLSFFIITVLSGQTSVLLSAASQFISLSRFIGIKMTFIDKFKQFTNFVSLCFVTPKTFVEILNDKISFQLEPVISINILGVFLLLIVILGIILNYKDKFMQVCFWWILFSFVILCLIGWGTEENALILYGLYFSWAYIGLMFKTLEKIFFKKNIFNFVIIIIIITIGISIVNIKGLTSLIEFGIKYYSK